MVFVNSGILYGPKAVFPCCHITTSHYHHVCGITQEHWKHTVKDLEEWVDAFLSIFHRGVSKMWSVLSFIMLYCSCRLLAHSLPYFKFDNWENFVLHLIIIIKSEIWPITHCLGFTLYVLLYSYWCVACLDCFVSHFCLSVVFTPNLDLCHLHTVLSPVLGTLLMSDA